VAALSAERIVLDRDLYRQQRAGLRAQMIGLRAQRRVRLGDSVVLEFENHETLQYQVQEMVYAEGISAIDGARDEVSAYSRFLPASNRLVATLFIELADPSEVRTRLEQLRGLQQSLELRIGPGVVTSTEIPGPDEDGPSQETYSVHFVAFELSAAQAAQMADLNVPVELSVNHEHYQATAVVGGALREQLLGDLRG
jgi:Protein of unknown function (DUF3501)